MVSKQELRLLEQTRAEASTLSYNVFASWNSLNAMLKGYGNLIQSRWERKRTTQRRQILAKAWPNIPEHHRPDVRSYLKDEGIESSKDLYLFPSINLEDLLESNALLLMIDSRGRHLPHRFANADLVQVERADLVQAERPHVKKHVLIFNGRTTPGRYGELRRCITQTMAEGYIATGEGSSVSHGLTLLRVQAAILDFLCKCCKDLLQGRDLSPDTLAEKKLEPMDMLEPASYLLHIRAAEAPYRLPTSLNLEVFREIADGRLSSAQNEIFMLRENPGFFTDRLDELHEHRRERIPCLHWDESPWEDMESWDRALNHLVRDSYRMLGHWSNVHEKIIGLQRLQAKHRKQIAFEKPLPEEYMTALQELYTQVECAACQAIRTLADHLAASEPLRGYVIRYEDDEECMPRILTRLRKAEEMNKSEASRLNDDDSRIITYWLGYSSKYEMRLFKFLPPPPDKVFKPRIEWDLGTTVDMLERAISDPAFSAAWITPCVKRDLSNVSLFTGIMRELEGYHPWAKAIKNRYAPQNERFDRPTVELDIQPDRGFYLPAPMERRVTEAALSLKELPYPVNQRGWSKDKVDKMRRAEKALDDLWDAVDEEIPDWKTHPESKDKVYSEFKALSTKGREGYVKRRTPAWDERRQQRPTPGSAEDEDDSDYYDFTRTRPFPEDSGEKGKRKADIEHFQIKKDKKKTKGTPNPPAPEPPAPPPPEPEPPAAPEPKYKVSRRSLRVFQMLVPAEGEVRPQGELHWKDFTRAMTEMGFGMTPNTGTEVTFNPPPALELPKPISVHKPHDGKMPRRLQQGIGDHFNRVYEWSGEDFGERDPGERRQE